jgi:transcription-repair coupling factor (superfamily II helicase)
MLARLGPEAGDALDEFLRLALDHDMHEAPSLVAFLAQMDGSDLSIKRDMEASRPMDRLVCGDVGFGKTEVAIRAAFKAVTDSKQVAVLVPTTILSLQHYRSFKARLSSFPVTVDYINRFKSAKEITETLKKLAAGQIDILIGTMHWLPKGSSSRTSAL